jgi:hypothetical protein
MARTHRYAPRRAPRARAVFRGLGTRGLEPAHAGNLTAYLYGLPPIDGGWAISEIERLLFLRHLVEHGHLTR